MKNDYVKGSVLTWEGRPPFKELLPLALQHIVAMVVGCVTPAIIVGGITNSSAQDTALLVQSALLIAGIATIIQLFPIGRNKLRLGSGLPLIMGVSFAYIPSLISIGGQ